MRKEETSIFCLKCKYRLGKRSCKAFPEKIPLSVYSGMVEHNKILEGQVGTFVYEPSDEFVESDKRIKEQESVILSLYESYKELLPKLIHSEAVDAGYDMQMIERIVFRAKQSTSDNYTIDLTIEPRNEKTEISRDRYFPGSEIYATFRLIAEAERIRTKQSDWVNLVIFNDGSYQYLDSVDS